MKTILVPIDLSTATESVCASAAALAKDLGAKLVLLHIVQPPVITSDYGIPMENLEELVSVSEKAAAKQLQAMKDKYESPGLTVELHQVVGAPVPLILEEARSRKVDYLVMGSHGHTALYDLLVGTTTHGILKAAPCPVIIVPRKR
jgi:nucleotide-binding universal stress UspA family protein